MQRLYVLPLSLFVVQEYVVEGAVDNGVEPILEPVESCCIRYSKVDRHPGTLRVAFGSVDCRGRAVDARCRVALRRVVDRVMARTRPRVQGWPARQPSKPTSCRLQHLRGVAELLPIRLCGLCELRG